MVVLNQFEPQTKKKIIHGNLRFDHFHLTSKKQNPLEIIPHLFFIIFLLFAHFI